MNSSNKQQLELVRPRYWTKTVAAIATPELASKKSYATATITKTSGRQADIDAITGPPATISNDQYQVGDALLISGATTETRWNTWCRIAAIPDSNTLTVQFDVDVSDWTNEGSFTIGLEARLEFRACTVIGRTSQTDNTGAVFLGPVSGNGTQLLKVAAGEQYTLVAPEGCYLSLRDFYLDAATAGEGLTFLMFP